MASEIWVLAEQWRGQTTEVTFEVLALGREVATALGVELRAVILGPGEPGMLGAADAVTIVDHPTLAGPVPEAYAAALARLAGESRPQAVLIPITNTTVELGPLVAARLRWPFINFCRDVRVADGRIEARSILYGGKAEATVTPASLPAILGVLPGSRAAERGRAAGSPPVTAAAIDLPAPAVQFGGYIEPVAGDVDITQQKALVAVGRGIQRPENLTLAEELAQALGGAVCGSRPVIDQGWLPATRQVGTSGMIVKPELYLAFGISGAPEHVEGMKHAALIIAVNTDARAPIFTVAHYGAVADALEVLPALTEAVQGRRGGALAA